MSTNSSDGFGDDKSPPRQEDSGSRPKRLASGTSSPPVGPRRYCVRVTYREPTYAKYAGSAPKHYRWTYFVQAHSADRAEAIARAEFRETQRLSSVSWGREIEAIEVEEA